MRTGSFAGASFVVVLVVVLGGASDLKAHNPARNQLQSGSRDTSAMESLSGPESPHIWRAPIGTDERPEATCEMRAGSAVLFSAVAQLPRRIPQRQREEEEMREKMEKEQAKKLNEERFENLKRDTDRLLKLSTELKEYVDKANKDTLSLDVIRKAEEIEKLARSVKEKMKGSY